MMLEMNIDRFSMIFSIPDHGTGTLHRESAGQLFRGRETSMKWLQAGEL
jgi:hypothetical protein